MGCSYLKSQAIRLVEERTDLECMIRNAIEFGCPYKKGQTVRIAIDIEGERNVFPLKIVDIVPHPDYTKLLAGEVVMIDELPEVPWCVKGVYVCPATGEPYENQTGTIFYPSAIVKEDSDEK